MCSPIPHIPANFFLLLNARLFRFVIPGLLFPVGVPQPLVKAHGRPSADGLEDLHQNHQHHHRHPQLSLIHISLAKAPAGVTVVKCKLDRDDGRYVYEVEMRSGRTEYDCEINAVTGVILDWEVDTND